MPKRKRQDDDHQQQRTKKYNGVMERVRVKRSNGFEARINIDGKKRYHGTYDTAKEAAEAYDRAAIQAGRPISKLNYLDQVPKGYEPKKHGNAK